MLLKPVVVFISLLHAFRTENPSELQELVTDFLRLQNIPTAVTAFVCWNKDYSLEFWRGLSNNGIKSTIRNSEISSNGFTYPKPEEHQMFLLDMNCVGSKAILHQISIEKVPRKRFLLWGNVNQTFDGYYFGVGSEVYIVDNNKIKSIYQYGVKSTSFVENHIGTWEKSTGFTEYLPLNSARNRSDLMGEPIRISYVITNSDTYNHLWDYRDTHIDAITKLNYILVHHLTKVINCTVEPIYQPTWGYKNLTTGIYSGLIGDLQTGHADLGGTPSFFTADRIDIVDFIAATTPTFMKFIFRAPPLTYVTNVFTLPFDTHVWYMCFALTPIILIGLYVIVVWEWRDPHFKEYLSDKSRALRANIFDVFMMEIGAITQQGSDTEPHSSAGRIATFFVFLVLMFLYNAYSANIVALLQSTTDSIRTLDDLLNSRMKLGVEDIVYAHYYFENAKEPTRKAIYEQKVAPKGQKPNFMTVQEGIKRMQEGFFAFHVELSTGYKVVGEIFQENQKCGLKEIEFVNLVVPMVSSQKNSTYNELFKVGLRKIQESGIQNREVRRVYTRKPVCHTKGSNFGSVGLIDCYSAFLIFGIGIACCFILLTFELLFERYPNRSKNKLQLIKIHEKKFHNNSHDYTFKNQNIFFGNEIN